MGRMCAAAALAITVTVGGVTALAPAASADVAVASAATGSAAPSSPQGPETRQVHPDGVSSCVAYFTVRTAIPANIIMDACDLVTLVPPTHPTDYLRMIALAVGVCAATMRVNGASYLDSVVGCGLSGLPIPFTQEEWCATTAGTACLNAWGGGPYVNDSTTGFESGDNHQNFFLSGVDNANGNATGNYQLGFAGSGSWAGQCIGDASNNSGDADTSLDGCGNSTGGGSGWGTNFTVGTSGCPAGEEWFHNNHWNGYLGPGGSANGSHFYLNKPTPYCFNVDFF
jgi:hypothetical protein